MPVKVKALKRPLLSTDPGEYVKVYPLLIPEAKTLSISPAAVEDTWTPAAGGAREAIVALKPPPYVVE
jgi:hypothetical protein